MFPILAFSINNDSVIGFLATLIVAVVYKLHDLWKKLKRERRDKEFDDIRHEFNLIRLEDISKSNVEKVQTTADLRAEISNKTKEEGDKVHDQLIKLLEVRDKERGQLAERIAIIEKEKQALSDEIKLLNSAATNKTT